MITTFSSQPQQEERPSGCSASAAFPDLSSLSTLWVPLHEVRQAWAAFGKEALTWLSRAVQDLDCAFDRWQQVLSWLDLAGNDHRQQDPESLEMIRTLMAQVQWHQGRRRALHQQVLSEYIEARQHKQQWEQQDREHRTGPLSEEPEEEV